MNKPRRLSGIVKSISDPIFGKKSMLYGELISNWPAIAGKDLSQYAVPLELKFKRTSGKQNTAVLKLAVTSARAQDVLMQKDLLIEKLNQFMGFAAVEDIQLVHKPHSSVLEKSSQIRKKRTVSQTEKQQINDAVSEIENEELKHTLQSFGNAIYSRQTDRDPLKNND